MPAHRDQHQRFWEKVNKSGPVPPHDPTLGPCWLWTGPLNEHGRGQFRPDGGGNRKPHVVAWEWENGPRPEGAVLDHKCLVRHCVRPSHMEAVTDAQNKQNRAGATKANATGFRGVSYSKVARKYHAYANVNGVRHYGGLHETPEEAAEAAQQLRLQVMTHNRLDRLTH